MASSDAQKSEVHDTTGDAATSPQSVEDRETTRKAHDTNPRKNPKRQFEPLTPGTRIIKDQTDDGGPLIVESDDPDLPHRENDKGSER